MLSLLISIIISVVSVVSEKPIGEEVTAEGSSFVTECSINNSDTIHSKEPSYKEKELFDAINREREKAGLQKLALDKKISFLSEKRSYEQYNEIFRGHIRPNGNRFSSIFFEYGYTDCSHVGEVIAIIKTGYSAEKTVELFLNSPSHKEIILNPDWVKSGLAINTDGQGIYYVVMLFAY